MISNPTKVMLALALAAAGCGGGGGSGSSSNLGTAITCSWFAGSNCWKDSAAAAHACTDGTLTGKFDAATLDCTYADSTEVRFDPSAPASACAVSTGGPNWDFTVVSSTATSCARYVETNDGRTLTTRLGTFTESTVGNTVVYTCPDGSKFNIDGFTMLSCPLGTLPGFSWSRSFGLISFGLLPQPPSDPTFWRCGP